MRTGDNYLRDRHLKGPDIQPVSDRALPRLQHTNTRIVSSVLCPLTSSLLSRRVDDSSDGGELLGWLGQHCNAIPTLMAHIASGQQRYADHKSLIHVSARSLTEDPRPQTLAVCNLDSRVCSEATFECYPILAVQTCMIKC